MKMYLTSLRFSILFYMKSFTIVVTDRIIEITKGNAAI